MIVSDADILSFLNVYNDYFEITAANDVLNFKYDGGAATSCDIADGTYSGNELATAMKTAIDLAFTITSTVAYSSTTRKFSITVAEGHTIQFILSGSDASLTCGFTENSSASRSIVSDSSANGSDPTAIISVLKEHVEAAISKHCRRVFESTSYSKDRYDGSGTNRIFLRQRPIAVLDRLAVGTRDVIRIKNSDDYSTSSVSVTSTGIRLVKNGVANTDITFASYTTLSTLANAISAVGNGWEAVVASSEYNSFASSELLEVMGLNTIYDNWVYLTIPEDAEDRFEVNKEKGIIYRDHPFPQGFNNIIVNYEAGYSSSNMPSDLKLAVKIAVKFFYQKWKEESWNVSEFKTGDLTTKFDSKDLPKETLTLLSKYRRILV